MNTLEMEDRFEPREPSRRVKGLVIVIALHLLLGYALVSGLARKGLNLVKKPMEAVVIQEVIIPPPPPPPPPPKKIEPMKEMPKLDAPPLPFVPPPDVAPPVTSTAPAIQSTQVVPTAPAVIAPPSAPVQVGSKRTSIELACPKQVPPELSRKVLQALQGGIEGVIKAQIHVKGGTILDVTVLSGPRVFHAAVRDAMMQYTCATDGGEVIATQEFSFKVE